MMVLYRDLIALKPSSDIIYVVQSGTHSNIGAQVLGMLGIIRTKLPAKVIYQIEDQFRLIEILYC